MIASSSSSECHLTVVSPKSLKSKHTSKQQQPDHQADEASVPQRHSQRQAHKGTFTKFLQQQHAEDAVFAEFEAAVKRAKPGPGVLPAAPLPPVTPPVVQLGPNGEPIVKRKRGRPPKPRPLVPVPTRPLLYGSHLQSVLREVRTIKSRAMPVGTPVWVKLAGYCAWPALVWSLELCSRATWPDIILSYVPGKLLVRFYGEHSSSWAAPKQLTRWDEASEDKALEALRVWGKKSNRSKLVTATLDELAGRAESVQEERSRMCRLGRTYQLDAMQAAARQRLNSLLHPHNAAGGSGGSSAANLGQAAAAAAAALEAGLGSTAPALPAAATTVTSCSTTHGSAASDGCITGNVWGVCDVCREEVPDMRCGHCRRWLHALCASPPALTPAEYPQDCNTWKCPACAETNTARALAEDEVLQQAAGVGSSAERMGLTPDWIISTAAFKVFQLQRPTPEQPYIAALLDPASNSKLEPNIPAELLYDKKDDGLNPSNPWKGYYVILNPDFRAQVQWRFVNRAIDEVENGNVPAVLLICRNSTDTAYFQRLRPYPRILLRRSSAQFKDYDKSPIGFGVVLFCIAKTNCRELYERFFEGFEQFGEPNIPIDKPFMASGAFYSLLDRLRLHAEQHARDHWVQCSLCGLWRIISWQQLEALQGAAADWSCNMLRPPHTSCATPQSRMELAGMHNMALVAAAEAVPDAAAAAAAAGGENDSVDAAADATPQVSLHIAVQQHQDTQPKSKQLLPALQQALQQQAAVADAEAAAAAAGRASTSSKAGVTGQESRSIHSHQGHAERITRTRKGGSLVSSNGRHSGAACSRQQVPPAAAAAPARQVLPREAKPARGAAAAGGASVTEAAAATAAAPGTAPLSKAPAQLPITTEAASPAAAAGADLQADAAMSYVASLQTSVLQLQCDLTVAYLCKAACGQLTAKAAKLLLTQEAEAPPPAAAAAACAATCQLMDLEQPLQETPYSSSAATIPQVAAAAVGKPSLQQQQHTYNKNTNSNTKKRPGAAASTIDKVPAGSSAAEPTPAEAAPHKKTKPNKQQQQQQQQTDGQQQQQCLSPGCQGPSVGQPMDADMLRATEAPVSAAVAIAGSMDCSGTSALHSSSAAVAACTCGARGVDAQGSAATGAVLSPGLSFMAAAVKQQLSGWMVQLVRQQLQLLQERHALIQQVLLSEQQQEGDVEQQHEQLRVQDDCKQQQQHGGDEKQQVQQYKPQQQQQQLNVQDNSEQQQQQNSDSLQEQRAEDDTEAREQQSQLQQDSALNADPQPSAIEQVQQQQQPQALALAQLHAGVYHQQVAAAQEQQERVQAQQQQQQEEEQQQQQDKPSDQQQQQDEEQQQQAHAICKLMWPQDNKKIGVATDQKQEQQQQQQQITNSGLHCAHSTACSVRECISRYTVSCNPCLQAETLDTSHSRPLLRQAQPLEQAVTTLPLSAQQQQHEKDRTGVGVDGHQPSKLLLQQDGGTPRLPLQLPQWQHKRQPADTMSQAQPSKRLCLVEYSEPGKQQQAQHPTPSLLSAPSSAGTCSAAGLASAAATTARAISSVQSATAAGQQQVRCQVETELQPTQEQKQEQQFDAQAVCVAPAAGGTNKATVAAADCEAVSAAAFVQAGNAQPEQTAAAEAAEAAAVPLPAVPAASHSSVAGGGTSSATAAECDDGKDVQHNQQLAPVSISHELAAAAAAAGVEQDVPLLRGRPVIVVGTTCALPAAADIQVNLPVQAQLQTATRLVQQQQQQLGVCMHLPRPHHTAGMHIHLNQRSCSAVLPGAAAQKPLLAPQQQVLLLNRAAAAAAVGTAAATPVLQVIQLLPGQGYVAHLVPHVQPQQFVYQQQQYRAQAPTRSTIRPCVPPVQQQQLVGQLHHVHLLNPSRNATVAMPPVLTTQQQQQQQQQQQLKLLPHQQLQLQLALAQRQQLLQQKLGNAQPAHGAKLHVAAAAMPDGGFHGSSGTGCSDAAAALPAQNRTDARRKRQKPQKRRTGRQKRPAAAAATAAKHEMKATGACTTPTAADATAPTDAALLAALPVEAVAPSADTSGTSAARASQAGMQPNSCDLATLHQSASDTKVEVDQHNQGAPEEGCTAVATLPNSVDGLSNHQASGTAATAVSAMGAGNAVATINASNCSSDDNAAADADAAEAHAAQRAADDDAADADAAQRAAPPRRSLLLRKAPICLSQGTILQLTADPLLRALLLEQPALMRSVRILLHKVCMLWHARLQQQGTAEQEKVMCVQGSVEADLNHVMFDLHHPGSDLICWDTLDRLAHQPSRVGAVGSCMNRRRLQQQQHSFSVEEAEGGEDDPETVHMDARVIDVESDEEEVEFMSSLALSREQAYSETALLQLLLNSNTWTPDIVQARVAANRAYMRGLGLANTAVQHGLVDPLDPNHAAMVAAARKLAQQAAVTRAEKQVAQRQRLLDARRRARRQHEAQLRAKLDALTADEAHAQQLVLAAQQALEDVKLLIL